LNACVGVEDVERKPTSSRSSIPLANACGVKQKSSRKPSTLFEQCKEELGRRISGIRFPAALGGRAICGDRRYSAWPSFVHADGFKPTHLRRQRSDLTDFRGRTSSAIEELRRREYGTTGFCKRLLSDRRLSMPVSATYRIRVSSTLRLQNSFDQKLRTYRSTGDLHRGTDSRPTDHQRMTEALKGKIRSVCFELSGIVYC
jgi:hypothetical protein